MSISYNLDVRCYEILEYLLYRDEYITVQQIAEEKEISKRSAYYDIRKISEWMETQGIAPLEIERKKGILIDEQKKGLIRTRLREISPKLPYIFSPVERKKIIICSILQRNRNLHIDDFMELCQVSRNTIINDIKEATKEISKYQLLLTYENGEGYHITGDLVRKRSIYFLYFNSIADFYKKRILPLDAPDKVQQILDKLKDIEDALDTQYVAGTLYSIAVFFSTIENRTDIVEFTENEKLEIMHSIEYEIVSKQFTDFEESEQLYLALHLLGSRTQNISVNFRNEESGQEYQRLSKILVKAFSRLAGIEFTREEELVEAIAAHLKTSLYRYRYGIQLGNPLLHDIKNEYGDLVEVSSRACKDLESEIGVPIPEGEIAYITLHFGAFINSGQQKKRKLRVLVVCPNGLSTANMLCGEIHTLVPNAHAVDIISMKNYHKEHNYNVVISTIAIPEEKNLILVHPILTDNDRILILKKCMRIENRNSADISFIAGLAAKYMTQDNLRKFKTELTDYFSNTAIKTYVKKGNQHKGICQMLEEPFIRIVEEKMGWVEAVRMSGEKLINDGYILPSYLESIVDKTRQYGPYMFITDSVFLAHSDIEDGSKHLGISFTIFKQPVLFHTLDGQERKAKIILTLCAEDQVTHIRMLNDIMTIFEVPENAEKIWKLKSAKGIRNTICKIVQEET